MSGYRLLSFFHDPIHKPMVLTQRKSHERIAKELASTFGVDIADEDLKVLRGMDVLASATERLILPQGADTDPKFQVMDIKEVLFRHPFCGKAFPLQLTKGSYNTAEKTLREVLSDFGKILVGRNDIDKLTYLWHHLLLELKTRAPEIPWELLPADTRVPDHTIWDHLKLTTATSAVIYEDRVYASVTLFIWTLGPVQSFIRLARKAQDFWAGSFILSYLTFMAIKNVIDKYGPMVVIYPDLQAHPWILANNSDEITRPTIPNRFVALIPETDREKLKTLAKSCDEAVKKQLKNWINIVLNLLNLQDNADINTVVNRQLESAFASHWVALPFPKPHNQKKDYEVATELLKEVLSGEKIRRMENILNLSLSQSTQYEPNVGTVFGFLYNYTEKALASRKLLRDRLFGKPEPGNHETATKKTRIERCHLCGERNAVVIRRKTEFGDLEVYYYNENIFEWIEHTNQPDVGARELPKGEGLCSVCLIKRFLPKILQKDITGFPRGFSFPSVSDVAVSDLTENWAKNPSDKLKKFETIISNLHVSSKVSPKVKPVPRVAGVLLQREGKQMFTEGEWFFEASLQRGVIERTLEKRVTEDEAKEAQKALSELLKDEGRKPCPYYAFVAIDGDQIGKWLAGEKGFPLNHENNLYHPKVWQNHPFKDELSSIFKLGEGNWGRPVTPAYHATMARALQTFALKIVPRIIEKQNLGQIIYAGGDDVLAFVNLRDLWKVLRLLRAGYSGLIRVTKSNNIEVDKTNTHGIVRTQNGYWLTMGPLASLSAGVVVAHYKTPLSIVISQGFAMEKIAKELYERDSFAITWLKHSGEITTTGCKWYINEEPDFLQHALIILSYFSKPDNDDKMYYISKGFIKEVQQVTSVLYEGTSTSMTLIEPLIQRATKRHIKYTKKLKKEEKRKIIQQVSSDLMRTIKMMKDDIQGFLNLLEIGLLYKRFADPEREE